MDLSYILIKLSEKIVEIDKLRKNSYLFFIAYVMLITKILNSNGIKQSTQIFENTQMMIKPSHIFIKSYDFKNLLIHFTRKVFQIFQKKLSYFLETGTYFTRNDMSARRRTRGKFLIHKKSIFKKILVFFSQFLIKMRINDLRKKNYIIPLKHPRKGRTRGHF